MEDKLQLIFDELNRYLPVEVLADMLSKMNAISEMSKGDGAGLTGGTLIDMFITAYLPHIIKTFKKCHIGEGDCNILDVPVSIKKISGKSEIALDWSKNKENSKQRERFNTDIMIINIKTEQWWKRNPSDCTQEEKESNFYSTPIKAGIYMISKTYCKANITLSSNNKTNSLIDQKTLYKMLKESIKNNMVIEFPTEVPKHEFNILNSFA